MKKLNVKTLLVTIGLAFISIFLLANLMVGNKSFSFLKSLISTEKKELIKTYIFPYYKISQQEEEIFQKKNEINEKQKLISSAIIEFDKSKGRYIDVHSWQFEPYSLSDILRVLIKLNLINFKDHICFGPVHNRNEFCLELIN